MYRRILAGSAAALVAVVLCPVVNADSVVLGGGWQANWVDGDIGITVDLLTPDSVRIQISKDFDDPPSGGVFPPRLIDFVQIDTDPNTVPRIIIADEIITNLTGVAWTDYHWGVLNGTDVWFNVPLSQDFDVSPFTNKVFSDPLDLFEDPNKATDLDADGGVVPNTMSFLPGVLGGELVIDVDLSPADPLSFTFKQFPTPEPSSLLLLGLGAFGLRRR